MRSKVIWLMAFLLFVACNQTNTKEAKTSDDTAQADPLPSWEEGKTKAAILTFVKQSAEEGSPNFIPIEDRIATFDNDGTLWSEKPAYFQLFFAIDRVKALAPEHPEWKDNQPFKAVLEDDMKTLSSYGEHGILEIVMATHAGNTLDEFEQIVKDWLATAKHPRFDRPYTDLVYQPMLELLDYLRANDFKTFIVSGGGIDFMRPWVENTYGIPKDQVVGSSIKTEFTIADGQAVIKKLPAIDFIDDKAGKPIGINKFIGRKPVFAAGNSDGDLQMLQWTDSSSYPSFQLYVHHTDAEREWAYDRESSVGRLDKGLEEAASNGWTVASMKDDWKLVYPFELEME
ncbi:haloacid dehalogenase-like hydrolase [Flavobacteriaceae bacterium D16]|nr:haloacid dehalogenase-like hydrolase [Flavobacteriaceae bacterium D16]